MTDISLVLLDLNGVLYRYDREARITHLASVTNQTSDTVTNAIWTSGFEDSGDAGDLDAAAYLRGFDAALGGALSEADWLAAQQVALTPIAATLALLSRIRPDVQSAVLTNNNLLLLRHFPTLYPELVKLISDRACVSAEFGVRKPHPDAYRRCLLRLGVPPEATLFVDDSPANVEGACEAGLQGLEYTDPAMLELELRSRGIIV